MESLSLLNAIPLSWLSSLFQLVIGLLLLALVLDTFNLLHLKPENRTLIYTNLISVFMAAMVASAGSYQQDQKILKQQDIDEAQKNIVIDTKLQNRPLLYIQIADESQRPLANQLRQTLIAQKISAPGIERVSSGQSPSNRAILKHFSDSNTTQAQQLAAAIQRILGPEFKLDVVRARAPKPVADNQFELWFAR